MSRLDDRLTRELERTARPADPSRAFERVDRKRARRSRMRKVRAGALAVAVITGTVGGFAFLSNTFREPGQGIGGEPHVQNGSIVYSQVRNAGQPLWVVQPDGTGAHRLTTGEGSSDSSPSISPDGQTVAFTRTDKNGSAIYTIGIDGGGATRLVGAPAMDPTWSPDGSQIAFAGSPGGPYGIYVIGADGTNPRIVEGTGEISVGHPTWSPDGASIAFEGTNSAPESGATWDIYTTPVDGGGLKNLSQTPNASEITPVWSPDGSRLAFVRDGAVWLRDVATGDESPLTSSTGGQFDANPSWSPDGQVIVFDRTAATGTAVFTIRVDGSALTSVSTNATDPAWQPIPISSTGPSPTATVAGPVVTSDAGPTTIPGVPQPACNVTKVTADFWSGTSATVYVYQRKPDVGGCPAPGESDSIVGIAPAGGAVTGSYGPLSCQPACHIFAAPDIDGDGLAELAISQVQGASTVFFTLYRVVESAPGVTGPTLVLVSGQAADQIAWGGPVTRPEGAYCRDGASAREFWVWQASPLGGGPVYHVSEHLRVLIGNKLKDVMENSYDVSDFSKLPDGGGATLCGAPVIP
jgi:TolB protein